MADKGICAAPKRLEEIGEKCKIQIPKNSLPPDHTSQMVHLCTPPFEECYVPFFHHTCLCNEIISVTNRVLGVVPPMRLRGRTIQQLGIDLIVREMHHTRQEPYGQFALLYTGAKRERYMKAAQDCLHSPCTKRDAGITMFVKKEKTKVNPNKLNPDPRAVQFRDAKYCVELASFLKPMEHQLYNLVLNDPRTSKTRIVAKGMNQIERGKALYEKFCMFKEPIILTFDAKRFDKHVSVEQLKLEHQVYLHCYNSHHLARLLSWQLQNHGRTRNRLHYVTEGKRMSGDMNTALGNCIIVISMFLGHICATNIQHFEMLDDGDDILILLEQGELQTFLDPLSENFLNMGHEIDLQCTSTSMEHVTWCQSSPIQYLPNKWKFVRDPFKTMSNGLVGTRFWSKTQSLKQMHAIGLCELALNLGVPILQEYALCLIRNSKGKPPVFSGEFALYLRAKREIYDFDNRIALISPKPINLECRLSFEAAFGVDVYKQVQYEKVLRSLCIDNFDISWCENSWDNWELIRQKVEFATKPGEGYLSHT